MNSELFVTLPCQLQQPCLISSLFINLCVKGNLLFVGDGVLLVWEFLKEMRLGKNFFTEVKLNTCEIE